MGLYWTFFKIEIYHLNVLFFSEFAYLSCCLVNGIDRPWFWGENWVVMDYLERSPNIPQQNFEEICNVYSNSAFWDNYVYEYLK